MSEKEKSKMEDDLLAAADELKQNAVSEQELESAAGGRGTGICCDDCTFISGTCMGANACYHTCISSSPS